MPNNPFTGTCCHCHEELPVALSVDIGDGKYGVVCYRCAKDREYDILPYRLVKLNVVMACSTLK